MRNNKILVLLSSYNGEKYIKEQILSIVNQDCTYDIEILIRDDGSIDQTVTVIKELQNSYSNIKLVEGTNIGYIKSFFELIRMAKGFDYYALSDQDDVWLNDKLQTAIDYLNMEKGDLPLLYGSISTLVDADLLELGTTQKKEQSITVFNTIIQNILPGHTQVMNNKMIEIINKKTLDCDNIYVHDSLITNIACINGKIIFENKSHTLYRQHNSNEIGYGKGFYGWFKERIRRINNSDNKKYAKQIEYIYQMYREDLSESVEKEITDFLNSRKYFITRIKYILRCKLYRQRNFETVLFKFLYIIGGYK